MLRIPELLAILTAYLPTDRWVDLDEIYRLVARHAVLDAEDLEPDAPGSSGLRRRRNVRNVLQYYKVRGKFEWSPPRRYRKLGHAR